MDASTEDAIQRSITQMLEANPGLDEHALRNAINAIGQHAIINADHNSVKWETPAEMHEKYYVFIRESLDGKTVSEILESHRLVEEGAAP